MVLGCLLAPKVAANKLKTAVAMVAMVAGLQLVWSGSRTLLQKNAANAVATCRKQSRIAEHSQSGIVSRARIRHIEHQIGRLMPSLRMRACKRGALDAEDGGGTTWSGDAPLRLLEDLYDVLALSVVERARRRR